MDLIINDGDGKPDFSALDYSAVAAVTIWEDVQDILAEQDGLCGNEIADKLDAQTNSYEDASIRHGFLPQMREALDSQHFISVTEEPGEDEKITKKVWRLHQSVRSPCSS